MASLRNVVKRREHRERAQPAERRHLGLLEKKKDYKQRANDFHRKEKELKRLAREQRLARTLSRSPSPCPSLARALALTRSRCHAARIQRLGRAS
jgi:hypothetical protein